MLQDYQEEEPLQLAQMGNPERDAAWAERLQGLGEIEQRAIAREREKRKKLADLQADPNVQAFLAREQEQRQLQQLFQKNPKLQEQFMLEREKARLRGETGGGNPISVVGPDGKPVLVAPRDAIGKTPAPKTSIAGTGTFSPEALAFTARQYLTGDRQAVQGFARNATARIALQNEIVDQAAKMGLTPEQTAAKMAEFAGTVAGSRTVGQRAANISLAATEAQEMIGIVKESSDKFGRTNFVPWNMAIKAYESGTGDPEIAAFGASINALVNVYARAINPTGVPTISDKEHARIVLNSVQSPAQVDAVLGIIRRELEIAKKAPEQVRKATTEGITGQTPTEPAAPKVGGPYSDAEKERRYQEYKARQK